MGKIDHLKRITLARIEAFLDTLEKPEVILPQLLKEMSRQVTEAANAQAKALSAVKGARRRLDEAAGKVSRLGRGAELAVRANDMETARQAIAAQIEAEREAQRGREELERAENAWQSASTVCGRLKSDLEALKAKKGDLLKKHRQQQLTRQLLEQYTQSVVEPGRDILDAVARMETKIEQHQIDLEVQSELTRTLGVNFSEERVRKLERNGQVDQRLNDLKKQLDEQ